MKDRRISARWFAAAGFAAATAVASILFAAGSATAAPAGDIRPAGGTNVVANSYIVVLKDGAVRGNGMDATVAKLVARYGGKTGHVFRHALRGFEISTGEAQARQIA